MASFFRAVRSHSFFVSITSLDVYFLSLAPNAKPQSCDVLKSCGTSFVGAT